MWEDVVLAVTCEFLRMVGVGKAMLAGAGASEEDDSDLDPSR